MDRIYETYGKIYQEILKFLVMFSYLTKGANFDDRVDCQNISVLFYTDKPFFFFPLWDR